MPDPREDTESLLESGFFSCFTSPVIPDTVKSDEEYSEGCRDSPPCFPTGHRDDMEKSGLVGDSDSDSTQGFKEAHE